MSKLPLIEMIHLLESKLGERWTHPILEPFKFDSSDSIKVQEAGKKIAQHLGLPPLTFIIAYSQQKSNVGGHIQLDSHTDVFIEIDGSFRYDCDIVLAILAHEICHKYLQINNIKLFPELENEMLTDAATVFTGLGKLSLNGCEKKSVSTSKIGETTTTTTTTQKVGYMNRKQFAFIYRLVCEMKRIPEQGIFQGLTFEAQSEVRSVSSSDGKYFDTHLFNNDFTEKLISETIKNEIDKAQKSFAKFNRNIRIIQESVLLSANEIYSDFHLYNKTKTVVLRSSTSRSFSKEAHNYMKNLIAIEELAAFKAKVLEKENEMIKFGNALRKFIIFINKSYPKQFSKEKLEFLFQFECPSCKNKMRIAERKLARVKCPKCNYSFIIDTGDEEIIEPEQKEFATATQKRNGLWTRIKSHFRIGRH